MIKRAAISLYDLSFVSTIENDGVHPDGINLNAPYRVARVMKPDMFEEELRFTQEYELAGYLYLYPNGMVDTK